jgi:hypothetical protein
MPMSHQSRPTELAGLRNPSVTARVIRAQTGLSSRISDVAWSALHVVGAHRWRDGYETDAERGWSRYRGSRCTVCDSPWEGW